MVPKLEEKQEVGEAPFGTMSNRMVPKPRFSI